MSRSHRPELYRSAHFGTGLLQSKIARDAWGSLPISGGAKKKSLISHSYLQDIIERVNHTLIHVSDSVVPLDRSNAKYAMVGLGWGLGGVWNVPFLLFLLPLLVLRFADLLLDECDELTFCVCVCVCMCVIWTAGTRRRSTRSSRSRRSWFPHGTFPPSQNRYQESEGKNNKKKRKKKEMCWQF